MLRKPPAALITLSGVPFANSLSSPVVGIVRPSVVERSSSGERNNSLRGEHGSKTKANANRTLLRDMCRHQMPLGRQAQACFWQELTVESCFRTKCPSCLSWGRKGAARGALGPVLPKGELVAKPSEVGDWSIPWCLLTSWVQVPKHLDAGEG